MAKKPTKTGLAKAPALTLPADEGATAAGPGQMNFGSAAASGPSLDVQLRTINQLINANRSQEALTQAQALFEHEVARNAAKALAALAAAMLAQNELAHQYLNELPAATALRHTELLLTVGSTWFKLGEMPQALDYLQEASVRSPEHPLVQARLGACMLSLGRIKDALVPLEKAVTLMPQVAGARINVARAYLASGEPAKALEALDAAAALPDLETDLYNITRSEVLVRLGRRAEAVEPLREAVRAGQSKSVPALVQILGAQGEHDEAWSVLREALDKQDDSIELLELASELAQVRGRYMEADRFLDRALTLEPDNANLWRRRAMMATRRLGADLARVAADKALNLTRNTGGTPYALALVAHAHVLVEELHHAQGEAAYREALEIMPKCAPAFSGLGNLLMQLGRMEEAVACFESLKEIAPLQGWNQLISAREIPDDPKVLEQMAQAARRSSLEGPVQTHMLFNLASVWEKKNDYEQAWAFVTEANEAAKSKLRYRPEVHRNRVEREMARFSKAFMDSRKGWGSDSSVPVFVLGMPRSGTTLVEQILGSHSQVFGAGELSLVSDLMQKLGAWEERLGTRRSYPECVDDMSATECARFAAKHLAELQTYAPKAQRIVDKLPHNFEHIGLIKLLFPNAKILHLKREPRDVAMSNYFTDFSAKFGGMGFAYDLTWIGEQLVDQDRLMAHWHNTFPGQILEVDYDALVEDVSGWAHKIISYLDLPWEEGVLSFQELERAVKTASVWQVRQPVYTTSKAKWKRYASHLAALESALAEVPPMPVPLPLSKLEPGLFVAAMTLLQEGKAVEAEASLRQLIQARPAHAAAHHFLGGALYQQHKYADARKEMERSLELLPGQRQWMENLATVEEALGKPEAAKAWRERATERSSARIRTAGPEANQAQDEPNDDSVTVLSH